MISPNPESVLCHCLRVTVGQVQEAIAAHGHDSLRAVMKTTGAGRACMSCHSRIRTLLAGRIPVSSFVIPACPGCSNPACQCQTADTACATASVHGEASSPYCGGCDGACGM